MNWFLHRLIFYKRSCNIVFIPNVKQYALLETELLLLWEQLKSRKPNYIICLTLTWNETPLLLFNSDVPKVKLQNFIKAFSFFHLKQMFKVSHANQTYVMNRFWNSMQYKICISLCFLYWYFERSRKYPIVMSTTKIL